MRYRILLPLYCIFLAMDLFMVHLRGGVGAAFICFVACAMTAMLVDCLWRNKR